MMHEVASALLHCEEISLDEAEAKKIAKATRELSAFYNVELSPEKVVWANFIGAIGGVYAPRFIAISVRKKREKEAKKVAPQKPAPVAPSSSAAFPDKTTPSNVEAIKKVYDFTSKGAE